MESKHIKKEIFLGFNAYTESDADIFKGRDADIEHLYDLVSNKDYVLCYAESGEGKSSLLDAGLTPRLRTNRYFPVKIAFTDEEYNNNNIVFDEVIKSRIMEAVSEQQNLSFVPKSDSIFNEKYSNDLWWFLRNNTLSLYGISFTIVLIFDQFEEVINYPKSDAWTSRFFAFLEKISTDDCPQYILDDINATVDSHDDLDFPNIPLKKNFKAIFSIRTEYIGELDYWCMQRYFIPDLKHNRFCLKPLTLQGADEVMRQYEGFDAELRDSIKDVLLRLKNKDNRTADDNNVYEQYIPALILSIVCTSLYQNSNKVLTNSLIADSIENFYNDKIKECNISLEERNTIASVLVDKDKRVRVASDCSALEEIKFNKKYKDALLRNRLIKKSNVNGVEYIELVHDSLIDVVKKHKEEAIQKELRKKRRRNVAIFSIMTSIILLFVILIVGMKKNEKNYLITQAKFITAEAEKLVETGDVYNAARLLNYLAKNNKEANNMSEFKHSIRSLDFNYDLPIRQYMDDARSFKITPDGKYIITGSKDKTVKLWSVETGNCKYIKEHSGSVYSVAVSPDGNRFISVTSSSVFLWDLEEGKCVDTINYKNYVKHVVFSPDGKYIVISFDNRIIVRSADGGSIIWDKNFNENIESAILTFDNKYIIAVGEDQIAKIWSIKDYKCIDSIKHHSSNSVSVNRDGDLLTLFGGTVKIWSINDTINDTVYMVCTDSIINNYTYDATFIHDGKILTRDNDNIIRVWGRNDVEYCCLKEYSCFGIYLPSCSDTNLFVSKIGDRLNLYMMENDKTEDIIINEKDVTKISFSPDGKYILTKSKNGVRLWSVEAGELRNVWLDRRDRKIRNAGFSPNGDYIFIHDYDRVQLWSIKDIDRQFIGFMPDKSWDKKITFSSNGKYLALATNESVKIWSIDNKECLDTIYAEGIKSMCFNCDKDTFIMLTRDTLRIRSINKKEWLKFIPTIGGTKDVILNPNGSNLIAISEENGYVLLISTENGECFDTIRNDGNSIFKDYSFFSKDGEYIFIRTNNMLRMYDGKTGEWLHDMDNQYCAKINSDGKYIITSNGNGILKLWSDKGYDCLLTAKQYIKQDVGIRGMDVSSDGKYIAVITDIGVHIRRLQLQNHFEISNRWSEILGPNAELTKEEKARYFLN